MAKNFFNLPPPWNPGYALPSNVKEEGLERHAYVTKMLARGTYDNSTDGSAGYAIPSYVRAEGTGRGTFTTMWTPRGYYGPRIPNYLNRQPVANIVLGDVDPIPLRTAQINQNALIGAAPSRDENRPAQYPTGNNNRPGAYTGGTSSTGDRRPGNYPKPPGAAPVAYPPPQSSIMGSLTMPLLLGGAASLAYRIFKKRKAEAGGAP
jgi:hypothetical protein